MKLVPRYFAFVRDGAAMVANALTTSAERNFAAFRNVKNLAGTATESSAPRPILPLRVD